MFLDSRWMIFIPSDYISSFIFCLKNVDVDNLKKAEDIIHVHNSGNLPPILLRKCSILPALKLSLVQRYM